MHLLLFLLFGLVTGALARLLVAAREPGGWVTSIVIGVLGSFAGGFVGRLAGLRYDGQPAGFVLSLAGAVVVVIAYHAVGRRASA